MIISIIAKLKAFVNSHFYDIMLFIIIVLLIMLSFAIGYITAKYETKEPIQIEN